MTLLLILAVLYWVPTVWAYYKKHPARDRIMFVNLLLGWTLVGWVVAVVWASGVDRKTS